MGTRNLTIVIKDKKPVVAQYGQWDGYPSGQGSTIYNFLSNCDLNRFNDVVMRCRFIESSKRKEKEIQNFLDKIGCSNGWLNGEQAEKYNEKYPFLTRDNGGDILNLLYEDTTDKLLWINNTYKFAADSLFCEWAYVIDLDKNTFEVYKGFNESPLTEDERFYHLQVENEHYEERRGDNQYYPVKLLISFPLNELPETVELFVHMCDELVSNEE